MVANDDDFDNDMDYFCQYEKELERYLAVSVCRGRRYMTVRESIAILLQS